MEGCFSNRIWGTNTKTRWELPLRSHILKISSHHTLQQLIPVTHDSKAFSCRSVVLNLAAEKREIHGSLRMQRRGWGDPPLSHFLGWQRKLLSPLLVISPADIQDPAGTGHRETWLLFSPACSAPWQRMPVEWAAEAAAPQIPPNKARYPQGRARSGRPGQATLCSALPWVVLNGMGTHPFLPHPSNSEVQANLSSTFEKISNTYSLVKDAIYSDKRLLIISDKTGIFMPYHLLLRVYSLYYQSPHVALLGPQCCQRDSGSVLYLKHMHVNTS